MAGPLLTPPPTDHYLASLLDQASDAIISTDREGRVASLNRAAEELFGCRGEEAIGQPLSVLDPTHAVRAPGTGSLAAAAAHALERGERVRVDLAGPRLDGATRDIAANVAPVRDEDGAVLGLSIVARDVSAERRAEEALREASRQRDAFIAVMSHELRTPLTAILGYSDLLLRGTAGLLPGRTTTYVQHVREAGHRLLALVNGLLEYSRLEAGGERLHLAILSPPEVAREVMEHYAEQARAKDIDLRESHEPDVPPIVADAEKLRQLLGAFMTNALKFTPRGGSVTLCTGLDEETPDFARIGVTDSGLGLERDQVSLVWDHFYQVDASLTRENGGIGLGLAIARHLAHLQGGRVWAESDGLGKGSTFWVALPLAGSIAPGGDESGADAPGARPADDG